MLIRLDERLTAVAALVDYGSVADVGCDHGKLGFYLLGTERANSVIASVRARQRTEEITPSFQQ